MATCAVATFPRREPFLRPRLYQYGANDERTLLAELRARNPVTSLPPPWNTSTLPIARSDQGVTATLLGVETGRDQPSLLLPFHPEPKWTHFLLRLRPAAPEHQGWKPSNIGQSDATGNHASDGAHGDYVNTIVSRRKDGDWDCWVKGVLCTEEPSYKLKLECEWNGWAEPGGSNPAPRAALGHLDPLTTWELKDLTIPRPGYPDVIQRATLEGVNMTLHCPPAKPTRGSRQMTITVTDTSDRMGRKLWLSLRHVSDQSGRLLRLSDVGWIEVLLNEPPTHRYSIRLEPSTQSLHLVFSAHRSRVMEYIIAPPH